MPLVMSLLSLNFLLLISLCVVCVTMFVPNDHVSFDENDGLLLSEEVPSLDLFADSNGGHSCHIHGRPRPPGHPCHCSDYHSCSISRKHRCICRWTTAELAALAASTGTPMIRPTWNRTRTMYPTWKRKPTIPPTTTATPTIPPTTPYVCANQATPLNGVNCICSGSLGSCISTAFFDARAQQLNAQLQSQLQYDANGNSFLSGSTHGVTCAGIDVSTETSIDGALCSLGCSCA